MPFALNEATRFISPTKTPEFLAAGVPVVSTPITDVVRPYGEKGSSRSPRPARGGAQGRGAARASELALAARVDRHLAAGSWDKTWAAMHKLMLEGLGEAARPGASAPSYIAPAE